MEKLNFYERFINDVGHLVKTVQNTTAITTVKKTTTTTMVFKGHYYYGIES